MENFSAIKISYPLNLYSFEQYMINQTIEHEVISQVWSE